MEMPFVTSALEARHEGHVLDALGAIGIPHIQQRTLTMVPVVAVCAMVSVMQV